MGLDHGNSVLDFVVESDLLIEDFEGWHLSDDAVMDFAGHGVEALNLDFHLLFLQRLISLELLDEGVTEVWTRLEEVLEVGLKLLLPKEGDVVVLAEELLRFLLNFVEVVGDLLHGTVELELVLDLDEVITTTLWVVHS